jgi:hypothetical protein
VTAATTKITTITTYRHNPAAGTEVAHRFSFNGTYIDRRYYPVGKVIQRAMTINMGLTKTTLTVTKRAAP